MTFKATLYDELRQRVSLYDLARDHLVVRTYKNGEPFQCNCPKCGSGEGRNKSAALTMYPEKFWCYACEANGDVFDLVGLITGATTLEEQAAILAEWYNLDIEGLKHPTMQQLMQRAYEMKRREIERKRQAAEKEKLWQQNRSIEAGKLLRYQEELPKHKQALEHLKERKISLELAQWWRFGYNPQTQRIVIPYAGSNYYHVDRTIHEGVKPKYLKPDGELIGSEPLWNPEALGSDVVVICEGPLDALAISNAGYPAIACGGVGTNRLIEAINKRGGYDGSMLLMFDNPAIDKTGATTDKKLSQKLQELAIHHQVFTDYPEGIKDAFEWWQEDRKALAYGIAHSLVVMANDRA